MATAQSTPEAAAVCDTSATPAVATKPVSAREAVNENEVSPEVYLGVVKSYNDRRGFGFLACAETALRYGRDVYMPKAEAAQAAAEAAAAEGGENSTALLPSAAVQEPAAAASAPKEGSAAAVGAASAAGTAGAEKPPPAPRLAEEDLVRFQVRLSIEGFPQAAYVKKLYKFSGLVVRPPQGDGLQSMEELSVAALGAVAKVSSASTDAGTESTSQAVEEIPLRHEACGLVRLVVGDEVTFCVPDAPDLCSGSSEEERAAVVARGDAPPGSNEVKLLFLSKTTRSSGSVLGCFTLDLPRTGGGEGAAPRPNLALHCHAFGDKLILAGLPADLEEAELMRFFSKQGASSAIVAHARTCSFASVSFPSVVEVARFLGRVSHAFADEKDTLMAKLLPLTPSADVPLLPALPAPTLTLGEELGALLVVWSPLVLAVAYSVELRPCGVDAPWATVEVASKNLASGPAAAANRFDSNCSSCKVAGLQVGVAYEARVSYFTECSTRSEASEASPACIVAAPTPYTPGFDLGTGIGSVDGYGGGRPLGWGPDLGYQYPGAPTSQLPPTSAEWLSAEAGLQSIGPDGYAQALPAYIPSSGGWRSASGLVVPAPAAPEVKPADEFGFAVSVQWPAVLQAAAYVVELREAGSAACERFVRSAPEAKLGTLVELRVGGLRPGPPPGRVYIAQVRTVAADGSESAPSPPGVSVNLPAQAVPAAGAAEVSATAPTNSGSTLSADAPPWTPSTATMAAPAAGDSQVMQAPAAPAPQPPANLGNWAPPPWLGHPQPGGSALGPLGHSVQPGASDPPSILSVAPGAPYAPAPGGPTLSTPGAMPPPPVAAPGPPQGVASGVPVCPPPSMAPGPPPGDATVAPTTDAVSGLEHQLNGKSLPPETSSNEECLILD